MKNTIYEKKNRIAYITLNRVHSMNALDDGLNSELWSIWEDFDNDKQVDVAILTGAGKAFCAGADLKTYIPKWLNRTEETVRENVKKGIAGGITRGQHQISKPIIAAVNGYALAGGFELALACDIRIASENAKFGVFEVKRGFHQGDGGIVRLVAISGIATALDLCLTGREVSAEEALRLGLIHKIVLPDQLLSTATSYAKMILENSQLAIRSAKKTIFEILNQPFNEALNIEAIRGYSSGAVEDIKKRLEEFYYKK